ncbi:MAG: hypothetical protein JXO48_07785 [Deltaproteobacteria bacterium]|nr:hypothetical protein [Deltaproteobacteria bacterium]
MILILRTPVGTFSIEPDETAFDMIKLCIGGIWLASFETVDEAANAVFRQNTSWPDWDTLPSQDAPPDIGGWEMLE